MTTATDIATASTSVLLTLPPIELSTDNGFKLSVADENGKSKYSLLTDAEKKSRNVDVKHQYVAVPSGKRFSLMLRNTRLVKADVTIKFEGKNMGLFRVNPGEEFCVKRPNTTDTAFIAHAEKSESGKAAGVVAGKAENGIVELTIVFEKEAIKPVVLKKQKGYSRGRCHDEALECNFISSDSPFTDPTLDAKLGSLNTVAMRAGSKFTQQDVTVRPLCADGGFSFSLGHPLETQPKKYSSAALALGGTTGQTFNDCTAITEIDAAATRQLVLRILAFEVTTPEKSVAIAALPHPPRIDD
jgi:hypothetical protein